jgi:hypothetical protein
VLAPEPLPASEALFEEFPALEPLPLPGVLELDAAFEPSPGVPPAAAAPPPPCGEDSDDA